MDEVVERVARCVLLEMFLKQCSVFIGLNWGGAKKPSLPLGEIFVRRGLEPIGGLSVQIVLLLIGLFILEIDVKLTINQFWRCLLYTSPSPRDRTRSRMPSSA